MRPEISTLGNGLAVITARLPGFRSAAVATVVNAGSRFEAAAENGVAHFLEHMAFKGTATRTAARIGAEVERLGASIDAFTSASMTVYHVTSLKETVPTSVEILGDVLTASLLAEGEVERERGVILEEIRRAQDSPQHLAFRGLGAAAYPAQPLGRGGLGTPETVAAATRVSLAAFAAAHQRGPNMAITCAGDVEHGAFRDLVAERFAALPSGGGRSRSEPARWVGGFYGQPGDRFGQVNAFLGLPTVPRSHPRAYAHRLVSIALGGGISSPLFQEVRERRALAYATQAMGDQQHDYGDFAVFGGVSAAAVPEFLQVVCALLAGAEAAITDEHVLRARNGYLAWLATQTERPLQLALHVAGEFLATGKMLDLEAERRRVEAITTDDVREAARDMLGRPPALSLVGPFDPAIDHYAAVCEALGAPAPAQPQQ